VGLKYLVRLTASIEAGKKRAASVDSASETGGMFDTYAESFDAVWATATPVREEG